MKTVFKLFSLSALLVLCACNGTGKSSGEESAEDSVTESETLQYVTYSYNKDERLAEADGNVGYEINLDLEFAKSTCTAADSINKTLISSIFDLQSINAEESFNEFIEAQKAEWTEDLLDLYEPESDNATLSYSLAIKCRHNSNAPKDIVTFTEHFENYEGGAHGSYYTFYYNFRKSDGHRLTLSEVYNGDPLPEILAQLLRDNDCKSKDELMEKTSILMLSDLFPTENFLLSGDSITFLYQIYDIAPYACGAISVTIPWKKF